MLRRHKGFVSTARLIKLKSRARNRMQLSHASLQINFVHAHLHWSFHLRVPSKALKEINAHSAALTSSVGRLSFENAVLSRYFVTTLLIFKNYSRLTSFARTYPHYCYITATSDARGGG